MEAFVWVIPVVAVVAVVAFLVVRGGVTKFVRKLATRKMSWDERDQMDRKRQLLAFDTLREFYAPRDEFQREWDPDKKKPAPRAWMSAYPEAVKHAWKAARKDSPTRLTLVRQQVAAAAESFVIETLPDEEQPHNAGAEHFSIVLDLNGKPYEQVVGLAPALKSQLRLHSLVEADNGGDFGSVRLVGHSTAPEDRLEKMAPGKKFLEENPAESFLKLPLAMTDRGTPWCLELHHTLLYALTGGGKTVVLHAIIHQLAPFVRKGLVEIWIADLKGTLARPYGDSSLIARKATDISSIERLVADFNAEMMDRVAELDSLPDDEQDSFSRVTPKRKLKLLLVDEVTGTIIEASRNRQSRLLTNATNITLLGRELNFYFIGAAQIVRRDIMENLRVNMVNGIALRSESTGWSSFVLFGNHEDKRGPQFDASQIEVANEANGYKTAGIGFVKGDGATPERVRFARVTLPEVRALAATFPPRTVREEPLLPETVVVQDEGFSFEDHTQPAQQAEVLAPPEAILQPLHDEAFTPMAHAAPRRSQVDDNAKIMGWDDVKLERNRALILADSSKRGSLWEGRLAVIEQEQRRRAIAARFAPATPSVEDEPLPDLNF
jgi:hypothetical protein